MNSLWYSLRNSVDLASSMNSEYTRLISSMLTSVPWKTKIPSKSNIRYTLGFNSTKIWSFHTRSTETQLVSVWQLHTYMDIFYQLMSNKTHCYHRDIFRPPTLSKNVFRKIYSCLPSISHWLLFLNFEKLRFRKNPKLWSQNGIFEKYYHFFRILRQIYCFPIWKKSFYFKKNPNFFGRSLKIPIFVRL